MGVSDNAFYVTRRAGSRAVSPGLALFSGVGGLVSEYVDSGRSLLGHIFDLLRISRIPKDPKSGYPTNSAQPGQMLRRLAVGFRTGDHTGSSVPVTAEGPGAFLFTGYMDQTDLFFKMAISLSGDTNDGDKLINDVMKKYPATIGKSK